MTSRSKLSPVTFETRSCRPILTGFPSYYSSLRLSRGLYIACALACKLCKTLAKDLACLGLCATPSTRSQRLAYQLSAPDDHYVRWWSDGCAVNYLTRCQ